MPLYPAGLRDFYPRPPRGGRHLTGDDTAVLVQFLSTPSARRATGRSLDVHRRSVISIHALREEGDLSADTLWQQRGNFYPRPPRGGRQNAIKIMMEILEFLSTPSARRATGWLLGRPVSSRISIHALREEGDISSSVGIPSFLTFLSTPSARRATCRSPTDLRFPSDFYPRPPRGGRQAYNALKNNPFVFLSTPSARRATCVPINIYGFM